MVPVDRDALEQTRDHAEGLVGDHQLLEAHLRDAVQQAGAEQEVSAGRELQQQAEGVLVGGLRVRELRLGAAQPDQAGMP